MKGERVGIVEMRRHYTNYFKGISNFKEHRLKLVTPKTAESLFKAFDEIQEVYADISLFIQQLFSHATAGNQAGNKAKSDNSP